MKQHNKSFEIDKKLPMPLYFQLKELLRNRIVTREWKPGNKIPTELEICDLYDVSRITARKALEELQNEGYLEKKQGKGTFVKDNAIEQKLSKFYSFSEELKKRGLEETTKLVGFAILNADDELASLLKIPIGDKVHLVSRIRMVSGESYAFERSYIPYTLAPGLTGDMVSKQGLYHSLTNFNIFVDSATEQFRAINLDAETAMQLGAIRGDAAISLQRTAYSGTQLVEYCYSIVVGDFFSYTVELK